MYKELDALFDEHASPAHCTTRSVQDALAPIADLLADVRQQIGQYRRRVVAAELAPHDNAIDPKLHMLHNALDGLDSATSDIIGQFRAISRSVVGFDRMMTDARADLANYATHHPPEPTP